ncbi:MAG: hypothetical protein WC238_04575 [Parcubacteria group bacterium]|jgi:hypothetical protein
MKTLTIALCLICCIVMAQDTIPVYIFADDTTYRPDIWYQVQDVNGDTTNIHYSNEYFQTIWGWQVDSAYLDLSFQPLDPKFKVLSSDFRAETLGHSIEEITEGGDTTLILHPEVLYFQGEPTVTEMEADLTLWQKITNLWNKITHKGSLMTGDSQKPPAPDGAWSEPFLT